MDQDTVESNTQEMSDLQKRLFAIRMKINQSRKLNKEEVEEEYKKFHDKSKNNKKKWKEVDEEAQDKNKLKSDERTGILAQTAEEAERESQKRIQKEKNMATFGYNALGNQSKYRAYEKRLKKLPTALGNVDGVDVSSSSVITVEESTLNYGKMNTDIPTHLLNRLTADIDEQDEKRRKFSRRRAKLEQVNVDNINDRNAKFNQKIKKAYDKYTVEIRQNLERGTAI